MLHVLDPFRLSAALAVRLARYAVLMVARALHGAEHVLDHAVDAPALQWDGEAGSEPVRAAAHRASGAAEDREHDAHDQQHDAQRREDADVGDEPDDQKDDTEDDHSNS
jgi:hypothetical protein